jgi:hypothetical protein
MPDELADVVGDLLADAFAQGPESDEEGGMGDEDMEPPIEEELPIEEEVVIKLPPPKVLEPELSKQERAAQFTNLLSDKAIDPFAQWAEVMPIIVTDSRYPLVCLFDLIKRSKLTKKDADYLMYIVLLLHLNEQKWQKVPWMRISTYSRRKLVISLCGLILVEK